MLNAITEKKPFVLGTRYGPGVEMDKDVRLWVHLSSWL